MDMNGMTPADLKAVTGDNGMFGGDGSWWIIILFLFLFAGNGGIFGNNAGAQDNYVLASDFATLQRQLSDGFGGVEKGIDTIRNGLCDGFYTEAQLMNNTNMNIAQGNYNTLNAITQNGYESRLATQTLGSQMAQCCCDTRQQISDGFCQTNYNNANNTRDLIDNQNAGTRAILDAINNNKVEALKEKIAEQAQMINSLQLCASQTAQNQYLVNQLKPAPVPAFPASNLYGYMGCNCN